LQKHNQQLTKQNKSIGLIKDKFPNRQIKIFSANQSMKRIREFNTNNELKPLIDLVGKWRFYIGIKEELSQEELFMNVTFIRENFNEFNLYDIKEAIDLSIKGDLNVDVEHYQNFSPLYISKILQAYKKHKGSVIVTINQKISEEENKNKKISIEDRVALTRASIKSLYDEKDNPNFYDYGNVTYEFIKKNNLYPISKKLVEQAMKYGKKVASTKSKEIAIKEAFSENHTKFKDLNKKKEVEIRREARNYVVIKWLNSIEDINKFIETITPSMI